MERWPFDQRDTMWSAALDESSQPQAPKRSRLTRTPYSIGIRRGVWDSPGQGCDLFEPPLGPSIIGKYSIRTDTEYGQAEGRRV